MVPNQLYNRALKKLFYILNKEYRRPQRAQQRTPFPTVEQDSLISTYQLSEAHSQAHTFALYRILGNDLTPRHQLGQTRENLRFILENEPPLPGCQKYWIVNRIVDPVEEKHIINLLKAYNQPFIHLPFEFEEYNKIGYDLAGLPTPNYLVEGKPKWLPKEFRVRLSNRIYRFKNNYVMHNNGARNMALDHGQDKATWVLPWDGNCFLSLEAWTLITQAIESKPWYPYWIIPMARTTSHQDLLNPHSPPKADQEPQIIFRSGVKERFNPEYYYGRRPKVELLWRLGVPGPWDHWAKEPWDLSIPDYSPQAGQWQQAGWVYRLPSGKPGLEQGKKSETNRLQVRGEATTQFLQELDAKNLQHNIEEHLAQETINLLPRYLSPTILDHRPEVSTLVLPRKQLFMTKTTLVHNYLPVLFQLSVQSPNLVQKLEVALFKRFCSKNWHITLRTKNPETLCWLANIQIYLAIRLAHYNYLVNQMPYYLDIYGYIKKCANSSQRIQKPLAVLEHLFNLLGVVSS